MKASPQWVDEAFANVDYQPSSVPRESMPLRDFLCPKERRVPLADLPIVDPGPVWSRPPTTEPRVTWLGHSTVLIEINGCRILTDPMWGKRASPVQRVGPKRFHRPLLPLAQLPDLDLILLSHDHYDHLDYSTIIDLAPREIPFVTSLGIGAHLEGWGIDPGRITELDWWESAEVRGGDVVVTATPAQHFSGRVPGSANQTLWSSFVVEGPDAKVFFGADSGMMPGFSQIHERFGAFDLVMLEIGAYHPAWGDIHLGPENALTALAALGGGPLLPIHWGTFDLATHRWDQPIETLIACAEQAQARLLTPRLGEPVEPRRVEGPLPAWWQPVAALHGPG